MKWLFKNQMVRNIDDGNSGGSGGTPPAPPSDPTPQASGNSGDQYDDFGYKVEPAASTPPPAPNTPPAPAQPAPATPPAPGAVVPPAAIGGYGNEPPPAPPAPAPVVPPVDPNAPPAPPALEVKTDGLDKEEAEALVGLSTKHGLTKEQAQAIIDQRIAENKQLAADIEKNKQEAQTRQLNQRRQWHNELKTDKTYGEQNFSQTTHKVNKVLSEVMTRTGKMLTNTSTMLLPDVMRDLADLHDKLFGTEKFDGGGNPPGGQNGTSDSAYGFLDELYK